MHGPHSSENLFLIQTLKGSCCTITVCLWRSVYIPHALQYCIGVVWSLDVPYGVSFKQRKNDVILDTWRQFEILVFWGSQADLT